MADSPGWYRVSEKGIRDVKKLAAAFVCLSALTYATAAGAVGFGANDDTGKYSADGGALFYSQMAAAGLNQNVITVRWKPSEPLTIPDRELLDRAVPTALAAGVEVVFAVYPYPPSELEGGGVKAAAFAEWLAALARTYPEVKTYIVGNEPNLNTFWRPQGNAAGPIYSGATFGVFLAAGYDALKGVSPEITVLGVGSSPRGDRAPGAAGKSSPVHFLSALGKWYRASNRLAPLMDGFSFHPYPNPSDFTVPFSFGYAWPNASIQQLPRIKQALYDAFDGTPQPTTLNGLKLYLDEVGWQVSTEGNPAYSGFENVKVTDEDNQAFIYDQLVRYAVCDPDVAQVNIFGYYDDRERSGWQAAPRRADGSPRPANDAIATAIAETGGACPWGLRLWTPLVKPERAAVSFQRMPSNLNGSPVMRYTPTAGEDVLVRAGFVAATTPAGRIPELLRDAGRVDANRRPPRFATGRILRTPQVLVVTLTAATNPNRVAVFKSPSLAPVTIRAAAGSSAPAAGKR
jgi:hypothetical protein